MDPAQLLRLGLFAYAGFMIGRGVFTCVYAYNRSDFCTGVLITASGTGLYWYLTIFT